MTRFWFFLQQYRQWEFFMACVPEVAMEEMATVPTVRAVAMPAVVVHAAVLTAIRVAVTPTTGTIIASRIAVFVEAYK